MIQCTVFRKLLFVTLLLLLPLPALASSTVNLSFAGDNSYILSGANLEEAGRIEVNVSYDSSLYGYPRLMPKSSFAGAMVATDGDTAGTVRINVNSTKPMNGNGIFATLAFDPIGTSIGYIRSFSGRVYGMNGASLIASFSLTNPTPLLDPSDPDDLPMIKEREAKGQSFMGGEVAYLPPEATVTTESDAPSEKSVENKNAVSSAGETTGEQPAQSKQDRVAEKAAEPPTSHAQSILDRFRLFKGERNPKNLMALFDANPAVLFKQEPPIFLADGKGSVRVTIFEVSGATALNFVLISAKYVSSKKLSENEWLVEARPDKGVLSAGISILSDGKPREIPLTVSPKVRTDLIRPGKVSEKDFTLYLKQRGTAKDPMFDLNRDGKRDYLDDYIFTANYLIALEKEKAKKGEQSGSQKIQKTRSRKAAPVKRNSTTSTAKTTVAEGKSKE